ncbi:MAG: hypothetical protein V7767_11985, partial [Leeuwenhoekiella sp.]
LAESKGKSGQIIISGGEGVELGNILESKTNLLFANSQMEQELLRLDKLIHVMNKPILVEQKTVLDYEMTWLPILFIFLFVLFHIFKKSYFKLKKISN